MPKKAGGGLDGALPKLKELYEFMTKNNLDALEVEEGSSHVKLTRRSQTTLTLPVPVFAPGTAAPNISGGMAAAAASSPGASGNTLPPGAVAIKSTLMGIFYRAPSPSSPPFVKEGEVVKAGQILCMIEAMKVFNEIKAEFAGTVLTALVENGKPVKSGQDLFIIAR